MVRKLLVALAVIVLGGAIATVVYASRGQSDLQRAKHAAARNHSVVVAERAGYSLLLDASGIACIDMPDMGAMGVHYANGSLVGDGAIDPVKPEAMVYAPDHDGKLHLAALEYVVLQDAWDAQHDELPSLFGQPFDRTASPNRYGLPAFYSLHVWLWRSNPTGLFSMWNPNVSCAGANALAGPNPHLS